MPGQHIRASPGQGPDSKCSKTVEVGGSCSELKPCQCAITTGKSWGKKHSRECSNITAYVSVQHRCKMAKRLQRVSAPFGNWTNIAHFTSLNHQVTSSCWSMIKWTKLSNPANLNWFFDCLNFFLGKILREIKCTRILDSKPLINTYYHIGHGLGLKYFLFKPSFCSMIIEQVGDLRKVILSQVRTWNLGQILEIYLLMAGQSQFSSSLQHSRDEIEEEAN